MNIEDIFDEIDGEQKELTRESIVKFQNQWNLELSETELTNLRKNDVRPSYWNDKVHGDWQPKKFENWTFPKGDFPIEFIRFIKLYSGCNFKKGEREFSLFGPNELREMNISYELPEYLKGAVSIGLDGAGNHIVIDMRSEENGNNYKIYGVHSGYLDWDGAKIIANNFMEFVNGTENIDEIVNG